MYSPKLQCWEVLPNSAMNVPRQFLNVVRLGNKLYALGGFSTEESERASFALKTCEVFDGHTWTYIAPMNFGRAKACKDHSLMLES